MQRDGRVLITGLLSMDYSVDFKEHWTSSPEMEPPALAWALPH